MAKPSTTVALKVVAIDHRFGDVAIEQAVLDQIGARVVDAAALDGSAASESCVDADAILVGPRLRFDKDRLESLQRCRAIVRYGVGVDNVDVEVATSLGIVVANVPDYCVEEVATHALAMILALNRNLISLDSSVRGGKWQIANRSGVRRLSECTLGIVGFGRIGEALARRAGALGMTVVASDPVRPQPEVESAGAQLVALEDLLARSDFISLHAFKSHGEGPILDADAIRHMKVGAFVVNVARAGLIDEVALADALAQGRLGGAALDVLDSEPPAADSRILSAPNLIFTPHVAWYSTTAIVALRTKAAEEVARILGGGAARNPIGR